MSRSRRKRRRVPLYVLRDDGLLPEWRRRTYPSKRALRERALGASR